MATKPEYVPTETLTWEDNMRAISSSNIVSNGTYTGEGVRIGIYESNGICDVTHSNFAGIDITINNENELEVDLHANKVATVLQECVDYANGNPSVFQSELMRVLEDTPAAMRRRR